jgi:hypothetical protein
MLHGFLNSTFEPSNLYDGHNTTQFLSSSTDLHIMLTSSGRMSGKSIGKISEASAQVVTQNVSANLMAELTPDSLSSSKNVAPYS